MEQKFISAKASMRETPYVAFKWETGFVVMSQEAFNKLNKKEKDLLLKPMNKKGVK